MTDRDHFHQISLDEFYRRHTNTEARITMEQLSALDSGMLVSGYSTNRYLGRNNAALRFTAEIEPLHTPEAYTERGALAFRLLIYSGTALKPIAGMERLAEAFPETPEGPSAPVVWMLQQHQAIHTAQFRILREGFFNNWVDDDISDYANHAGIYPERTNRADNSPL